MTLSYSARSLSADSFPDSVRPEDQGHLKQAIQEFLTSVSEGTPQVGVCPLCGKGMQSINATFALYGTDRQWDLELPVCDCAGGKAGVRQARAA